jgi:hypothetical protein
VSSNIHSAHERYYYPSLVLRSSLTLPFPSITILPHTQQVWTDSSVVSKITAANYQVIASPSNYWYLNIASNTWQVIYSYNPTANLTTTAQRELVVGGEVALWGEYVDDQNIIRYVGDWNGNFLLVVFCLFQYSYGFGIAHEFYSQKAALTCCCGSLLLWSLYLTCVAFVSVLSSQHSVPPCLRRW